MEATNVLLGSLGWSHNILEMTVGDLTDEQAHASTGGHTHPIAANYGHTIVGEDFLMSMIDGSTPLAMGDWAGRSGMSEMPTMDGQWQEWANRVKVDLPKAREYAQAVYNKSMGIVSALSADDLDRSLDLSMIGMGEQTVTVLINVVAGHALMHSGEISASKGMQGLQGYPF